jgi:hypothetical protein
MNDMADIRGLTLAKRALEVMIASWHLHLPRSTWPTSKARQMTEAPSPAARFPASPKGWQDAIAYACREREAHGSCTF